MDQLFINESNLQDSKNLLKWETLVFKDWNTLRLWGWSIARETEKWYSFLTEQENLAAGRITLVSLWWLCPYSIFPLFMKSVYLGRRLWVLSESTSHSRCLSLLWPRAKQSSAQHSPFSPTAKPPTLLIRMRQEQLAHGVLIQCHGLRLKKSVVLAVGCEYHFFTHG